MKLLKYILYLYILLTLSACINNKKAPTTIPKKVVEEEDKKKEDPYAYLGELTPAQNVIKKELIDYLKDLTSFNVDAIVNKTYPKLFNVINKQRFRKYISTMMSSKDIMIEKYDTNITKIGKVKAFSNGTQFCQVDYDSNAKILLLNRDLYKTETSMNYLYDVLIHKYGRKNITFNVEERTIEIKREEKMILIKEKDKPWKFIGDNLNYRRIYYRILPPEILTNLDR